MKLVQATVALLMTTLGLAPLAAADEETVAGFCAGDALCFRIIQYSATTATTLSTDDNGHEPVVEIDQCLDDDNL